MSRDKSAFKSSKTSRLSSLIGKKHLGCGLSARERVVAGANKVVTVRPLSWLVSQRRPFSCDSLRVIHCASSLSHFFILHRLPILVRSRHSGLWPGSKLKSSSTFPRIQSLALSLQRSLPFHWLCTSFTDSWVWQVSSPHTHYFSTWNQRPWIQTICFVSVFICSSLCFTSAPSFPEAVSILSFFLFFYFFVR